MRRRTPPAVWIFCLALMFSAACSGAPDGERSSGERTVPDVAELVELYAQRDYFTLRERLGDPSEGEPPGIRVLRAATAHAFNDLERSNRLLAPVLAGGTPVGDSLRREARRIRARNLLRLHRYGEAADAFRELTSDPSPSADSAEVADDRNLLRATRALADVPPQRVTARAATTLLEVRRTHVELTIGDSVRDYAIDTGANFSVLIRSEAEGLGLEVREAGLEVGSSTDRRVTADLAVAERVRLGGIELRDVVFLVVPDEMLTFPGLVVRGLIGFPVVEAAGEVTFRPDGGIEVPAEVPRREVHNLALHELTPYVRVGHGEEELLCVLDTGNLETHLYEPFYRRHRARIESAGVRDTFRSGGAGGVAEIPGYRLRDVALRVGGRTVTLDEVQVWTRPIRDEASNVLDCNLARDVLSAHGPYTINFRSMSVLLR